MSSSSPSSWNHLRSSSSSFCWKCPSSGSEPRCICPKSLQCLWCETPCSCDGGHHPAFGRLGNFSFVRLELVRSNLTAGGRWDGLRSRHCANYLFRLAGYLRMWADSTELAFRLRRHRQEACRGTNCRRWQGSTSCRSRLVATDILRP